MNDRIFIEAFLVSIFSIIIFFAVVFHRKTISKNIEGKRELQQATKNIKNESPSYKHVNTVFYIVYEHNDGELLIDDIPVIADFVINFDDIRNTTYTQAVPEINHNTIYIELNNINMNKYIKIEL